MFFAVTGALMLGVLGSASVGVNTQRYNDAVNTFTAIVQQEFTNVTNVVNAKSIDNMCGAGPGNERPRGISGCVIIGRLMTIDDQGAIVRSNIVGQDPGTADETDSELEVVKSYLPKIDTSSKEIDTMSWSTKLERGNPLSSSAASILIIRSPRSGNVYSYVIHATSDIISNDSQLRTSIDNLINSPTNSTDQYLCVDRAGWVASPAKAVKLAPFASGPSGVSSIEVSGSVCNG